MTDFTILPAIDLRGGRVVRLVQGDPSRPTDYGDDPAGVAARYHSEGAAWLHVVNLDAAFDQDTGANAAALAGILSTGLQVQLGGGLRDRDALSAAFASGVARVVLGTAAVDEPALVDWALGEFGPARVAAGIDVRAGLVRIKGWAEAATITGVQLALRLRAQGVEWCVFTDVARDGVSTGVNVAATVALAQETGLRVIASGGVAGPDDVRRVHAAGLPGVIVGRALYEGQVDLRELIAEHRI